MIKNAFLLAFTILSLLAAVATTHASEDPVRHVVVFNYKDGATDNQIARVTEAFRNLQNDIPGIVAFEDGVNNSPEGLNKGFTHVYVVTFENAEARDEYLPHPEHKKFVALMEELDILEDVFVIDYSIRE
ncbi:Dabb family protein [Marinimicrobium sp. C6131]|uniref:Dabb family protein n=1 Tax=Marinimicrobium sp. C6131 TaxID=3022676 RepID=UPI00223DD8E4|nr:Dabb family protein [Marinimicrobium sp. C6131]UZJ44448.1 Dabb family protein [Marinimicrobium sp. C6131]